MNGNERPYWRIEETCFNASAPTSLEYPATSAARMAASLRSTRPVAKAALPNRSGRIGYRLSAHPSRNGQGWHPLSVKGNSSTRFARSHADRNSPKRHDTDMRAQTDPPRPRRKGTAFAAGSVGAHQRAPHPHRGLSGST